MSEDDAAAILAAIDQEGLLVGLEGAARAERAELIGWLLAQGFSTDEIRYEPVPNAASGEPSPRR